MNEQEVLIQVRVRSTGDPEKLRASVERKLELALGDSLASVSLKKSKRKQSIFIDGPPPYTGAR